MEELTLEEAAELVLGCKAWKPCILCMGQGNISQKRAEELGLLVGDQLPNCEICDGKGYLTSPTMREAYRLVGVIYPEKPLSGPEMQARIMRQIQDNVADRMKGFIGQPLGPEILTQLDPIDPTLMQVNIKVTLHDHALSNEEVIEFYNEGVKRNGT
jgi:hypothetical protein